MTMMDTRAVAPERASHDAAEALASMRADLITTYLCDREAWEADRGSATAARYEATAAALMLLLTATGEYDEGTAPAALERLTVPGLAEAFTAIWAERENLAAVLEPDAIEQIAQAVRDWVADGADLDQIPMWRFASGRAGVAQW